MKVDHLLVDTAEYRPIGDPPQDDWGKPNLGPAQTVKCRKTYRKKLLKTKSGHELVDITEFWFLFRPTEGSKVDGRDVQAVEEVKDFKKPLFYKCWPVPPSGFSGSA